ncbi:two-component system VirA-like sensor kinase [Rhizobium leguminosarum bv. viciae]|nr:two-component system VirA-like sensor kinase [Rhizobium leguminosarum bv. viciae]TCB11235.1 two-component system VirA-like sensor kinase [Rhizobium leguminosarum bv. viciae]TCB39058.1 two-component system VirA-like sensor kinase [Rhizobium leguminosarum bv. viciae]
MDPVIFSNWTAGLGTALAGSTGSSHRRTIITTVWTVVMMVAALIFAIMAIRPFQDGQSHHAILTNLRSLDLHNASLQRDVLRARAGLLYNYDPLVDSIVGLHQDVTALRSLFERPETAKDESILGSLDKIQQSIDHDEAAVESFKTQNSLLQNSLKILGNALSDLAEGRASGNRKTLPEAGDLGNLMLQYISKNDDRTAALIRRDLDAMTGVGGEQASLARLLIIHGRLILQALPQVRNIIIEVQSSDTINRAQRLQHQYLEVYGQANTSSQWVRVVLGAASVMLCLYVVILVHRLRSRTERLTRRLNFEAMTKDVQACFECEGVQDESLASSMDTALNVIRIFFAASRFGLMIVDTDSLDIREKFGGDPTEIVGGRDLIATMVHAREPVVYRDLQVAIAPYCLTDINFSGRALSLRLWDETTAVCIIEFLDPRSRPSVDEAVLLENAVRHLLQTLNYHRKQQGHAMLERRLEHAERLQAVGTLAGGIAHEFNNILVAILGYGEMLLQLLRPRSTTRQYVQEIVKAAERSRVIIDQILALSRKHERVHKPFDLREVVGDIEALLRVSLPVGIELVTQATCDDCIIDGNPVDIQQSLMNLSKNAAEAMDGTGTIQIGLRPVFVGSRRIISHGVLPPGDYVVLSVSDTGKGIAAGVLANIFEPFFTTRSRSGGTGLGLAAVHGNVTALNGRIDVTSVLGEGTSFEIFIPRSSKDPVPVRQFFTEERVPLGNGEIVAIYEKDKNALSAYEDQLAALGYEPVGMSDWDQLADLLRKNDHNVEVLLIDINSIPSWKSTAELDATFGEMPVLFISEHPEIMSAKLRNLTPTDVIRKPVASNLLASALKSQAKKFNK